MNGLVNLAFPLFNFVDGIVSWIFSDFLRLILWGVFSGIIAMFGYWLCSNQQRIKGQQNVIAGLKQQLKSNDDQFDDVMKLSLRNLRESFKLLGMVSLPAILSGLPVLVIILWVSFQFGFALPEPGDEVPLHAYPSNVEVEIEPSGILRGEVDGYILNWPNDPFSVKIFDPKGEIHSGLPVDPPSNVLHQRRWWNVLLGNEAGYISAGAEIDVLRFGLQRLQVLPSLPGWMSTWEFTYFLTIVVTSLFIKRVFRIA